MTQLGVGAVSQRVVMAAARLKVPQIVASRRQVNEHGGYIGWTPGQLCNIVANLSAGETHVVRDHGGPYQDGSDNDDWERAFDIDVEAGFDVLHIDVSKLPQDEQIEELIRLSHKYVDQVDIEIGGERDEQSWLDELLGALMDANVQPTHCIVDWGGNIHADKQCGYILEPAIVREAGAICHDVGVKTKAHNADWFGRRSAYSGIIDTFNIAPEYSLVEAQAWLEVMSTADVGWILAHAYDSQAWARWFTEEDDEGTWHDRAICALRYCMMDEEVRDRIARYRAAENYVKGRIHDAIVHSI